MKRPLKPFTPDEAQSLARSVLAAVKKYPEWHTSEHRDWIMWSLADIAINGRTERHRLRAREALADRADPVPRAADVPREVVVAVNIGFTEQRPDAQPQLPAGSLEIHLARNGDESDQ